MKQKDIKPCALCGQGVMHSNQITFYRVRIEHMVVNTAAVQRQAGLEMMLGNAMLAAAMGMGEALAQPTSDPVDALVCQQCGITRQDPVGVIHEIAAKKTEKTNEG